MVSITGHVQFIRREWSLVTPLRSSSTEKPGASSPLLLLSALMEAVPKAALTNPGTWRGRGLEQLLKS